jgi:hypothetical protein
MPNRNWGQRVHFERNCQKCGENCGNFAEYCKRCGAQLPPIFLSEAELKESIERSSLIQLIFGGCGQLFHSFLQQSPEVIFCPSCGENLRPTVIN